MGSSQNLDHVNFFGNKHLLDRENERERNKYRLIYGFFGRIMVYFFYIMEIVQIVILSGLFQWNVKEGGSWL